MADYLRMAVRVHLAIILSADDGLRVLGTFAFVASHLLSVGRHQSSSVAELLRLIDRLEKIYTKLQGMISPPCLATTLLDDFSRQWIQYLNRCVAALDSKVVEAPGSSTLFSLKPILVEM